jgi:lysophospholipid acyltransferase (LPLAT)-like uncharacterized protein
MLEHILKIVVKIAAMITHLHRYSCKIEHITHESLNTLPNEFIIIAWHEQIYLTAITGCLTPLTQALVSASKDGDYLCNYLKHFQYKRFIRGSSRNGTFHSIREIIKLKRSKTERIRLSITPDGPLGPAKQIKTGLGALTNSINVPIIPVYIIAKKSWKLSTWDQHIIPKPFTYIVVYYGKAIPANSTDNTIQAALDECNKEGLALLKKKYPSTATE